MFFSRMESLRLHLFVKDSCWLYLRLCSSLFTAPLVLLKLFFAAVLSSFPLSFFISFIRKLTAIHFRVLGIQEDTYCIKVTQPKRCEFFF